MTMVFGYQERREANRDDEGNGGSGSNGPNEVHDRLQYVINNPFSDAFTRFDTYQREHLVNDIDIP